MMTAEISLLLTNRISPSNTEPLRAKEYWSLAAATELSELPGLTATEIGERLANEEMGERIANLLDAGTGFALARDEVESKGIRLVPHGHDAYPQRLRTRLGDAAPPLLYAAGPIEWLDTELIGVVGSRNVDNEGAAVAEGVAAVATRIGAGIVSGGAKGVDLKSMDAAYQAGVPSVGITAEGVERAGRRSELRSAVAEERLLLASPFAPGAGFSVGNAMGRNKIVYALASNTLVVASDHDSGGTWAGATEALRRNFGAVSVWVGPGGGPGNAPLVDRGALAVADLDQWQPLEAPEPAPNVKRCGEQLGLDL